jgi:hypothetical protein
VVVLVAVCLFATFDQRERKISRLPDQDFPASRSP